MGMNPIAPSNDDLNPRYVCYAKAHGKTPDEMLAFDKARRPGGCMCEYVIWIGKR